MLSELSRLDVSTRRPTVHGTLRCGALLAVALFVIGCAGQPPTPEPMTAPSAWVEAAAMDPRPASPASRNALAEGLRWILEDAPKTHIHSSAPPPWEAPAPDDSPHSGGRP